VAVKLLHPHLLPDTTSRERLAGEARAAASLSHPAIVGIYDVDAEGDAPALVMELIDGESLATRLQRDGPLDPRDAARVVAEVAEGLFHAHQRGIVHRDVKPGNVLLDAEGRAHLVDFGISHSLAASAERLTLAGTVIGTLRYMAPEQLTDGPIGPRTDLYGLGAVLHEALTGRPPFGAAGPVALVAAQRAGPPPMPDVDPALAAVTRASLAAEPTSRPLHAGAVAAALRSWLDGDPAPALAIAPGDTGAVTQPAPVVPAAAPAERPAPASEPAAPSVLPARARGSMLPLLAGLGVLALAAVVALAVLAGQSPAAADPRTTPQPTPTVTPAPTPIPGWMSKLLDDVAEECGDEVAAEVAIEIAGMDEKAAKDHVEPIIKACKDEDRGGGGDGNGNGGNSGPGGGGGGDD
jgi:serine/threonine protein kinase